MGDCGECGKRETIDEKRESRRIESFTEFPSDVQQIKVFIISPHESNFKDERIH